MNSKALKILISLFAINSITLFFYFTSHLHHFRHPSSPENRRTLPEYPKHLPFSLNSTAKPWPILPSYLPWSQNPNIRSGSCEAYFGNGFTQRFELLRGGKSWFRCFYSESLESSVCEGGMVRMHPEKIRMSSGGERLESVIGRGEDVEMPVFEFGAFDVCVGEEFRDGEKLVGKELLNQVLAPGEISRHTMRDLVDSIRVIAGSEFDCAEVVEEPTLLVTRFEYANLFHTITDWYSAYVASRVTGLPYRPHVVFVDGHCTAPLEETWKAMFSGLRYAKNFSGSVCFRHAILSPLGYETILFKGLNRDIDCHGASAHDLWQHPDNRKTARVSEFGEMIRASFGFPVDRHQNSKPVSGHNVLFVRREDYLAHPRHGGKVQSRLSNEQEVFDALKTWVSKHTECKINLINGIFAHMPMKEQVRAIQDASVIIGAHGAGLTHIVSATPKTVVLELISPDFIRPHFQLIAKWKGLEYHSMYLDGSSYARPPAVIDKLRGIMRSLGC